MYLNKVIIVGNLTRDPEMRALPSGANVTTFSVATNRVWNDKNGQRQEQVEYHNVTVFGRSAETSNQYLKKGSQVMIEGRLQTRSWDDKDSGKKMYRTEIIADRVQFGSRSGGSSASGTTPPASAPSEESTPAPVEPELETIEYPEEEINPDDIPF